MTGADDLTANDFAPAHRIVEADAWHDELSALKSDGYTYFDWLSAVDEQDGVRLVVHLLRPDPWDHLIVATFLADGAPAQSVVDLFAGAAWHERETHEMFGVRFGDGVQPDPLLLPDGFEGHPLRKDFVLASRVVKAWPGAKEPGESDHDVAGRSPGRRRVKPPGVPDDWLQTDDEVGGPDE
jgi:NADH-quinone oxidoreductase subunit C